MRTSVVATGYDPAKERSWHLGLWVSPEVHAWCVHDVATGHCMALCADNGPWLPENGLLPARPVSVTYTTLPEISTLVPEIALEPGSEMAHLRSVHGHLPTGLLRDEPIGALGARCIYLHDEQAEHRLVTRYPNARSLPLQAILVHAALAKSAGRTSVLIHRSAKRLDLALARDHRLLFSNTFHATGPEDVLYFTLFATERCGLRPDDTQVSLCGTHLNAAEEELLARYLPSVAPVIDAGDARLSGLALETPHRFAALLEQYACAS